MIIFIIISIMATTINLLNWYLSDVTPNVNMVVKSKLEKVTYEIITNELNTDFVNDAYLNNILNITKNEEGEILLVDYNLDKTYEINNKVNKSIRNSLNTVNNGEIENSDFIANNNNLFIEVPLFINSNFTIISSLGPKIPIKIDFIGTLITNLETKITSYGFNNVLTEIYVIVEIKELITTPVISEEVIFKYDILIDATLINGRVPMFYGDTITKESEVLDISLN